MHSGHISIWFFIGVLLTVYGAMIFCYGLYELATHQLANVVLANLHAPVWWGGLMLLLGLFYSCVFARAATVNACNLRSKKHGSAKKDDIWSHCRKPRVFSRITWPRPAAKKSFQFLRRRGRRAIVLGPEAVEVRRGGNVHGSAALRRAFQEACRRDRRHHRHAAEFRRRARHRGCDSPLGAEGAGAGAGHARPL